MLALALPLTQVLEAVMLICFGVSWPIDILKQIRTRTTAGKSLGFMLLIVVGYIAGVVGKCLRADSFWPEKVTWLYLLNAILVGVDIALYLHYSKAPKSQEPGTGN